MKHSFFIFFALFLVLGFNLQAIESDMIDLNCGRCYYKIKDEGNQEIEGKKYHYERYINVWIKDNKFYSEAVSLKGEPFEFNIMKDNYSYIFTKNSKKGQKVRLNQVDKSQKFLIALDKSVSKEEKGEKIGTEKVNGILCDVYEKYKTIDLLFAKYNYVMTSWMDKKGRTLRFKNEKLEVENGKLQRKLLSLSEVVEFKKGIKISDSKFNLPKDIEFVEIVLVPEKNDKEPVSVLDKQEEDKSKIKKSADIEQEEKNKQIQENQQTVEEKTYKKEKPTEEKILEDTVKKGAGNVLKGVLGW